jgi:hypothetical protein
MAQRIEGSRMLEVIDKGSATGSHPVPLLFVHGALHAAWWVAHPGYSCTNQPHGRNLVTR